MYLSDKLYWSHIASLHLLWPALQFFLACQKAALFTHSIIPPHVASLAVCLVPFLVANLANEGGRGSFTDEYALSGSLPLGSKWEKMFLFFLPWHSVHPTWSKAQERLMWCVVVMGPSQTNSSFVSNFSVLIQFENVSSFFSKFEAKICLICLHFQKT